MKCASILDCDALLHSNNGAHRKNNPHMLSTFLQLTHKPLFPPPPSSRVVHADVPLGLGSRPVTPPQAGDEGEHGDGVDTHDGDGHQARAPTPTTDLAQSKGGEDVAEPSGDAAAAVQGAGGDGDVEPSPSTARSRAHNNKRALHKSSDALPLTVSSEASAATAGEGIVRSASYSSIPDDFAFGGFGSVPGSPVASSMRGSQVLAALRAGRFGSAGTGLVSGAGGGVEGGGTRPSPSSSRSVEKLHSEDPSLSDVPMDGKSRPRPPPLSTTTATARTLGREERKAGTIGTPTSTTTAPSSPSGASQSPVLRAFAKQRQKKFALFSAGAAGSSPLSPPSSPRSEHNNTAAQAAAMSPLSAHLGSAILGGVAEQPHQQHQHQQPQQRSSLTGAAPKVLPNTAGKGAQEEEENAADTQTGTVSSAASVSASSAATQQQQGGGVEEEDEDNMGADITTALLGTGADYEGGVSSAAARDGDDDAAAAGLADAPVFSEQELEELEIPGYDFTQPPRFREPFLPPTYDEIQGARKHV